MSATWYLKQANLIIENLILLFYFVTLLEIIQNMHCTTVYVQICVRTEQWLEKLFFIRKI